MKIPSSYRYYELEDLASICGIHITVVDVLLDKVLPIKPSVVLAGILARNFKLPLKNEKAKSEFIVAPILAEVWEINNNFKPLSGLTFNVDKSRGLKGICDFLISSNPDAQGLDVPIMCVFEAKNDALEDWYGQCGSEMFAARLFNEQKGNDIKIIYGAVTNGFTWQFLKLENQTLFIDSQRYGTANLPQLLGAIQKIYNLYK
ncbi:MAG: hypothetical protein EAZ97_13095 [Bacteroidetes bacterium]|nr:MAG: hypothetical protein EAZ97_13095 [Bacteroidota bacterium]